MVRPPTSVTKQTGDMGDSLPSSGEALLRESPERSSGSLREPERSGGDELSKAAALAGSGVIAARFATTTEFSPSTDDGTAPGGARRTPLGSFRGAGTSGSLRDPARRGGLPLIVEAVCGGGAFGRKQERHRGRILACFVCA